MLAYLILATLGGGIAVVPQPMPVAACQAVLAQRLSGQYDGNKSSLSSNGSFCLVIQKGSPS